jgi:hypothetical protein
VTALLGTSATLEELVEVVGKAFNDPDWLHGVDTAPILAHDFSSPLGRLEIECRRSTNRIGLHGSQITAMTSYRAIWRFWVSAGKILSKLPDDWRGALDKTLKAKAPNLVKSHHLQASGHAPHPFIAIVQWDAPAYENYPRRMAIYGPMEGPEQVASIIRIVRENIALEALTHEDAVERAKDGLLREVEAIAAGRNMPTIIFEPSNSGVRAQFRLYTADLSVKTVVVHRNYRPPVIMSQEALYSGDIKEIERHFRYAAISDRQDGMMRITALAAWLLAREDGTVQTLHRRFSKDLLGRGSVQITNKGGRIEASYKSGKMTLMTGKVELTLDQRYPESIIASMKGKPLSALLGLEGIHDDLVITSLKYEGSVLVGRLRDNSQLFVDGETLVDRNPQGEPACI